MRGDLRTWMRSHFAHAPKGMTNQQFLETILAPKAAEDGVTFSKGGFNSAYYRVKAEVRQKEKRAAYKAKRANGAAPVDTGSLKDAVDRMLAAAADLERRYLEIAQEHAELRAHFERPL